MNTRIVSSMATFVAVVALGLPVLAQSGDLEIPASYSDEIETQIAILASAYQLDEATQDALWEELARRGVEADAYDAQLHQELIAIAESGDESLLMQRANELVAAAPLNEDRVAEWVEERLPAEVVQQGRPRFEELKERRVRMVEADEQDLGDRGGAKAARVQARVQRNAPVNERLGTPTPRGRKGEQIARRMDDRRSRVATEIQKPNAPTPAKAPAQDARPRIDRGKSDRQPTADTLPDAPYAKAPPLDEWDKHVASIAEKYAFTDAQVTKAQSILRDLRRRAYQYRLSRTQEYEAAEKIEDKAKRDAQLKYLDKAIDALFSELKQRLESLPTIEQRQKAGAGSAKPR